MATTIVHTDPIKALFLVVSVVAFALAAFGVHSGQFTSLNIAEFGLAFFAGSFLV